MNDKFYIDITTLDLDAPPIVIYGDIEDDEPIENEEIEEKEKKIKMTKKTENEEDKIINRDATIRDIESYREKIRELETELAQLRGEEETKIESLKPDFTFPDELETDEDLYLKEDWYNSIELSDTYGAVIMSLIPHFNLICGEYRGKHNAYNFEKQFTRKVIPHSDVRLALQFQLGHYTSGRYMILDEKILKKYDLIKYRTNMLDKNMIEAILNEELDTDSLIRLYNLATSEQKTVLVRLMTDKLIENREAYSAYLVSRFYRDCGIDLLTISEQNAEYLNSLNSRGQ